MQDSHSRSSRHSHRIAQLRRLAYNLWWTWNPEAQALFRELSPLVWRMSNHNAVAVLREVSDVELATRLNDAGFLRRTEAVLQEFEEYLGATETWARRNVPDLSGPVAYFTAEFGLHESLPIYSGGLGILSGDHMKSASDLGISAVGVSLFYRRGYFRQHLNPQGWQEESYPSTDPSTLPMTLVLRPEGGRLLNSVEIGSSTVYFQAWRVEVGRVPVFLLDTNLPENDQHFQGLTSTVYGGGVDTRIGQEIVLGIGGVRLLTSLGIHPSVYHMNEGHSAFLTLELLRAHLKSGMMQSESEERVRRSCMFTTHTPVPAGHDRFSRELMEFTFHRFLDGTRLSVDDIQAYGKIRPDDPAEQFTMTVLALRMSRSANGVSELHGRVSREMWKELYPAGPTDRVPIGSVTNGIHTPGWAGQHAHEFWNARLGVDWTEKLMEPEFWTRLEDGSLASDEELWALRCVLRRDMIEFVRRRLYARNLRLNIEDPFGEARPLSPDALTIGFARRFATYKRAPLIFRNLDRLLQLLNDPARPVQFLFSGKAHPRDNEGKRFIQQIVELSRREGLAGRLVFVEDYDINVARHLVSGADVWLNTPRRPLEASGTSGMKILIHGGLNLSIMDGWWREGFDGTNGWAIGDDAGDAGTEAQDDRDSTNLLQILSGSVIPEFFDRDSEGIPRNWIKRIRRSMRTLIPRFSTDRMVAEYARRYYAGPPSDVI